MNRFILCLFILLVDVVALAQLPPYVRNPITTNTPAGMTNQVVGIVEALPTITLNNVYADSISSSNLSLRGCITATQLSLWGDSLTYQYAPVLAARTPYFTYNKGVGSATSTDIYNLFVDATNESILDASISIICAGANNHTEPVTVINDVSNMVHHLSEPRRFLILAIPNGEYESQYIGGAEYQQITNINTTFSLTYSNRYLDIRRLLIDQYDPTSEQDRIDWTNDIVPASCRYDVIHWSDKGNLIVSTNVLAKIDSVYGVQVPTLFDVLNMMASPGLIGYSNPAPIKASSLLMAGSIRPSSDSSYALGFTNAGWSSLFVSGSGRFTGSILSRYGLFPLDGGTASLIWEASGTRIRVSGATLEPTPGAVNQLGDWNNRWSYIMGTNIYSAMGVVAGNVSIGQANSSSGVKNWGSVGIDNNGSVLLGANLFVNNSALAVVNTHASFAGSGIYLPGITRMRSGGIDFYARTNRSVTANNAVTENPAMVLLPNGNLGIGTTNVAVRLQVDGKARVSDTITSTNGLVLFALDNIPTNSIPASTAANTNWVLLNWTNTGPVFVATNTAASGSFLLRKPTTDLSAWP